jgi:hypothetical protein
MRSRFTSPTLNAATNSSLESTAKKKPRKRLIKPITIAIPTVPIRFRRAPLGIRFTKWIPISLVAFGVIFLTSYLYVAQSNEKNNPVTKAVNSAKEEIKFEVLKPAKLPSGYVLKDEDVVTDQGMVMMKFSSKDGMENKDIAITQQARPKQDFGKLINSMEDVTEKVEPIDSAFGKVYVFNDETGGIIANLITDTSWVIIRMPADVESSALSAIIENLKPI